MSKEHKIVYKSGEGEIVEKKSRFLSALHPVYTEKEAIAFIEKMKKKYWNAAHNCFAYVIGENREIIRCSDDGEPSGTAGKPMLDVLLGENLYDAAVVVTRYFGGTLLGSGGLVRAYSRAVREGLSHSCILVKYQGVYIEITMDYADVGKLQYLFAQKQVPIIDAEYGQNVTMKVLCPSIQLEEIKKGVVRASSGRADIRQGKEAAYVIENGQIQLLP